MFDFYLNTKVKFGCGVRKSITEVLQTEKWNRIGVVVDHNLLELPIIKKFIDQLQRSIDFFVVGECSISEPTYDALEDMRPKFADPAMQAVLGLGGGREVIPLVRMGFTVTGVDFAPSMVEQTRANLAGCGLVARLLLQEISQLNVPEDVYDIVWLSSGMYSSVPTRKRRVTMLRKIRNALVPGGYFVCMFFWDPGLSHSRKGLLARKFMACLLVGNIGYEPGDMLLHNIEFIHAFSSEKSLRSEFAEAGFEVIHLHLPDENKRGEAVLMKS